jgi:2-isopropylmalate synthase
MKYIAIIILGFSTFLSLSAQDPERIPNMLSPDIFIPRSRLAGMHPWTSAPLPRPVFEIISVHGFDGSVGFGEYSISHPDKFFSTLEGYNSISIPRLYITRQMMIGNTFRLARNFYMLSGILYGAQMGVMGNNCGIGSDIKYTELRRIISQISRITGKGEGVDAASLSKIDDSGIYLDKSDDQAAVCGITQKLGYDLSDEDCEKVYEEFKKLAEKKEKVSAKELDAIVAAVALQVPPTYKLLSYIINTGNIITASAQIKVKKADGTELEGISMGDGPIDAAFRAVEQITGNHYELDDFQIQSVTEGREAMGSALIRLRENGKLYSGSGISTDIIGASINAYLGAVNKIVYEEA